MPVVFVARTPDGRSAAAAGYHRWGAHIAQLGVITDPVLRRRGFAEAAVAAAMRRAIGEGLVPQWRCRTGNVPSRRLSQRCGFTEVGLQVAVALDDGDT